MFASYSQIDAASMEEHLLFEAVRLLFFSQNDIFSSPITLLLAVTCRLQLL
jgi:hypothetical protein